LRFGVIGRAGIQHGVQIVHRHQNSMRRGEMIVSCVVRCRSRELAGEGIHPGARSQKIRIGIQTRVVGIGASRSKMSEVGRRSAAETARVALQRGDRMLHPGLAHLFKAIVIARSAAHSIKILRNDGMIGARKRKPTDLDVSVIARGRGHPQTDLASINSKLRQFGQVPDDEIGSRRQIRIILRAAASSRQNR